MYNSDDVEIQFKTPEEIRRRINILSQEVHPYSVSQGLLGVIISIVEMNHTPEQRRCIWWWLFDGKGKPREMHTRELSDAQRNALVKWAQPNKIFGQDGKTLWLPQRYFHDELKAIWYYVWSALMSAGIVVDEKRIYYYGKENDE